MKRGHFFSLASKKTRFVALFLLAFLSVVTLKVIATTWTDQTASGAHNWTDVACSSDCTKIIAADSSDTSSYLYRSTDAGVTWSTITNGGSAFQKQWKRVASSSDGTHLIASELSGDVYYSTDSGANWTSASLGTASWTGLCMSDDGTVMQAIANGTQVGYWYSTNSGSSWTNTSGLDSLTPNAIACSSDGSKVVVGMFGNNMYYSSNTGSSWSALASSQSGFWNGVAMSSDGTQIAGVLSFGGDLWTSTDSGANWTDRSGAGTGGGGLWQSVAMSNDGATIVGVSTVNVKSSIDSGANWSTESGAGTATWKDVWVSDDGSYWVIGGTSTDIWTQGSPPASPPSVTASSATSVTTTTATFNGNITSTGNATPTTRGFHYGTTVSYGTTSSTSGSYSTGTYTASITGLTCNTTYHYEAFATNTAGTGVSSDSSFTTSACPVAPTVLTNGGSETNITASSATLQGNITDTGGENPSSRYVEYGLTTGYGSQSSSDTGSFSTGNFNETIHGLSNGATYHYRACATNTAGTGCGSDQTFTTLAAPGAPTSLTGNVGYSQISLSWTAPVSSGDYSITDYLVEYKTSAGSDWYKWPRTASTSTSEIVTGLTNGTSYDFRVSAVNYAGVGTASSTIARTPVVSAIIPNAPTGLSGVTASGQVTLTWTAPTNNGGASITDYQIEYKAIDAGSWSTFSHTASVATTRAVTGLVNGTMYQFRVSAVNSVGTGAASTTINKPAATETYLHILSTGQSLAEGVNSTTALSTTQPYNNLSLSTGPIAGSSAPLIPLVEGVVARESPISGMLNSLRASDVNGRAIIGGTHSGGGQTYASIKKGGSGGYYALGQTQASTAKSETESAGAFYQPYAVTIVHGESDAIAGTAQNDYATYMGDMQADYESDWNALTGLSDSIPFFESQMNTNSLGTIAVAQLDAHRDYPGKVILVGPKYQLTYGGDGLHLTNTSSRLLGEYFGKVMKKVLIDGDTWNPLMPKSVTRSGTTVTVSYKIPTGTLAIDTTNVAARTNKGFEFVQTGGSAISITGVALSDSNTRVAITLSGVPDGTDPRIRYAWTCENHPDDIAFATCGGPADSGAVGGNIRDTDTTTSPSSNGSGTALYDWSVAFDEPITDPFAPNAPTSLSATYGNAQVDLDWTAPVVDGGSSVSDYVVEYKTTASTTWNIFADGTSTSTSATVTGLTNGTNYEFRVSAVNSIGQGTSSEAVNSTPSTTPGAPTSLNATGGAGDVVLTWTAPVSDGGAIITDYVVEYKVSTDISWSTFSDGLNQATGTTVTGLSSSETYNFRVYTTNMNGNSSASGTATASTDSTTTPDAPTSLSATAGNTQVGLTWAAPSSDGGSSITDYVIEHKLSSDISWSIFADGTSTSTSATVTGLTNGSSYDFRVSAVNALGTGSASSTESATPVTVPGAPTSLVATGGDELVELSWTAPVSNGGSSITDYTVEYKLSSDSLWSEFMHAPSTSTSISVTDLDVATSYNFRVYAVNAVGASSASGTSTESTNSFDITTVAASGITLNSATLNGTIDSFAGETSAHRGFVYGTTLSYGSAIDVDSDSLGGLGDFQATISNTLSCGTTYHFAVSITSAPNSFVGEGNDLTFTTSDCPIATTSTSGIGGGFPIALRQTSSNSSNSHITGKSTFTSPLDNLLHDCPALVSKLSYKSKTNDISQTKLWQAFLNKEINSKLPTTGYFGPLTLAATKSFQAKYTEQILKPFGITKPTGLVATMSIAKANEILGCK